MLIQLKPIRIALIGFLLLLVGNLSAQTIKGTVSEKSGEPIIGATVIEAGSHGNGAITDLEGTLFSR